VAAVAVPRDAKRTQATCHLFTVQGCACMQSAAMATLPCVGRPEHVGHLCIRSCLGFRCAHRQLPGLKQLHGEMQAVGELAYAQTAARSLCGNQEQPCVLLADSTPD
jgi:hypothetical protein